MLFDTQDSQIGLPALECEKRVVVVTQSLRYRLTGNSPIEQATKGRTAYRDGLNAKHDDPSGKDIHHDQRPVTLEFEFCEYPVTAQQGGGLCEDGSAKQPAGTKEERA